MAKSVPVPAIPRVPSSLRAARFQGLQATALLLLFFVVWTALHGDLWLADRLYALEGHAWSLRHAWLTQNVIHQFGRDLSIGAWLTVLAAWLVARFRRSAQSLRRPLLYLLVAVAASTLLVSWVKSWSNVDCPWDLARYGGTRVYFGLFEAKSAGLARGMCFPAGHASGGYAWLALYFFLAMVRPQWRWWGLAVGLGVGLLFGIAQQLRGAHFLSHDIAAAAICWTCAVVTFRLLGVRTSLSSASAASPSLGGAISTSPSP
ncbi:phosphatase PAP2 family protein [Lysobacter terrae]